ARLRRRGTSAPTLWPFPVEGPLPANIPTRKPHRRSCIWMVGSAFSQRSGHTTRLHPIVSGGTSLSANPWRGTVIAGAMGVGYYPFRGETRLVVDTAGLG